jgi:hypothetical protein
MGEMRNAYKIPLGKCERKNHSEDLGVDGKIILKWFLEKYSEKSWTGCICLVIGASGGIM